MRIALCFIFACGAFSGVCRAADGKYKDLESCYQAFGQLETTQQGSKKVEVYKTEAEVAVGCNQRVIAKAKTAKTLPEVIELAGVIGTRSNWQSAMPVYTIGVKLDARSCGGKDQLYALDLALASPADNDHAKSGFAFMDACWKTSKQTFVEMMGASSGYTKTNLCDFMKHKNALPAAKKDFCEPH